MNTKKYFITLFQILIFAAIAFGIYYGVSWGITGRPPVSIVSALKADRNILLMGTDKEGLRSDVMMLIMVRPSVSTVDVLSIPRDSLVTINGDAHKINSALGIGKEKLSIQKVEEITGIKIDHYATISFEGFKNIIDILGGVDFNVPQNMDYEDPSQDLFIHLKAGQQHLDGKKAEQLVRFRGYPTADEGRIKAQQAFLKEIFRQKLTPSLITKAPQIASQIAKHVKTDIPIGDLPKYGALASKLDESSLSTHQLPGGAQMISKISYYVINKAETRALVQEIKNRQPKSAEEKTGS